MSGWFIALVLGVALVSFSAGFAFGAVLILHSQEMPIPEEEIRHLDW